MLCSEKGLSFTFPSFRTFLMKVWRNLGLLILPQISFVLFLMRTKGKWKPLTNFFNSTTHLVSSLRISLSKFNGQTCAN